MGASDVCGFVMLEPVKDKLRLRERGLYVSTLRDDCAGQGI